MLQALVAGDDTAQLAVEREPWLALSCCILGTRVHHLKFFFLLHCVLDFLLVSRQLVALWASSGVDITAWCRSLVMVLCHQLWQLQAPGTPCRVALLGSNGAVPASYGGGRHCNRVFSPPSLSLHALEVPKCVWPSPVSWHFSWMLLCSAVMVLCQPASRSCRHCTGLLFSYPLSLHGCICIWPG